MSTIIQDTNKKILEDINNFIEGNNYKKILLDIMHYNNKSENFGQKIKEYKKYIEVEKAFQEFIVLHKDDIQSISAKLYGNLFSEFKLYSIEYRNSIIKKNNELIKSNKKEVETEKNKQEVILDTLNKFSYKTNNISNDINKTIQLKKMAGETEFTKIEQEHLYNSVKNLIKDINESSLLDNVQDIIIEKNLNINNVINVYDELQNLNKMINNKIIVENKPIQDNKEKIMDNYMTELEVYDRLRKKFEEKIFNNNTINNYVQKNNKNSI